MSKEYKTTPGEHTIGNMPATTPLDLGEKVAMLAYKGIGQIAVMHDGHQWLINYTTGPHTKEI